MDNKRDVKKVTATAITETKPAEPKAAPIKAEKAPKLEKPFYKTWWFWLVAILFVVLIVVVVTGGTSEKSSEENAATTAETTASAEEAPTVSAMDKVPAGSKVEEVNGKWGLYQNGTLVDSFTGVANNDKGTWYISKGLVDFDYSGPVTDGSTVYQVKNGLVAKPE